MSGVASQAQNHFTLTMNSKSLKEILVPNKLHLQKTTVIDQITEQQRSV